MSIEDEWAKLSRIRSLTYKWRDLAEDVDGEGWEMSEVYRECADELDKAFEEVSA